MKLKLRLSFLFNCDISEQNGFSNEKENVGYGLILSIWNYLDRWIVVISAISCEVAEEMLL